MEIANNKKNPLLNMDYYGHKNKHKKRRLMVPFSTCKNKKTFHMYYNDDSMVIYVVKVNGWYALANVVAHICIHTIYYLVPLAYLWACFTLYCILQKILQHLNPKRSLTTPLASSYFVH